MSVGNRVARLSAGQCGQGLVPLKAPLGAPGQRGRGQARTALILFRYTQLVLDAGQQLAAPVVHLHQRGLAQLANLVR